MSRNFFTTSIAIFCLLLLSLNALSNPFFRTPSKDTIPNSEEKYFVLPFHLVDGFILIDVTINDSQGKVMFDTGTPFSFFLNNNKLELDESHQIAEGQAGSGQEIVIFKSDSLLSIDFNNGRKNYTEEGAIHANFDFVEKGITPDFLGFVGFGFFKEYEFVIDYDHQVIEFYSLNENGNSLIQARNTKDDIVGVIHFENDASKNTPEFQLKIGSIEIPATLDTGEQGRLTLTSEVKDHLVLNNLVKKNIYPGWYGQYVEEKNTLNLNESQIQDIPIKKIKNLSFGAGEDEAHLGYQFLKLYKTVWNFKKGTITLLER